MSEHEEFVGEERTTFGKGSARQLRRAGKTPAVIYGHGTDPVHLALPAHDLSLAVRKANALFEVEVSGKKHLVLVKDVQRDPVRQIIEHVDLLIVRRGERVEVDVPLILVGEAISGTLVDLDINSILLDADATAIPDTVEVNIEGAAAGTHILAKDLDLPKGVALAVDPDTLIIAITEARAQDLGEEEGEGEGEGEAVTE